MNALTSNASLVIHPENPEWTPNPIDKITAPLRNAGFIANEIQSEEQSYFVGDHFLDLIAFMGCSPNINLLPQDNAEQFCFVKLISKENISALTSQHTGTSVLSLQKARKALV